MQSHASNQLIRASFSLQLDNQAPLVRMVSLMRLLEADPQHRSLTDAAKRLVQTLWDVFAGLIVHETKLPEDVSRLGVSHDAQNLTISKAS